MNGFALLLFGNLLIVLIFIGVLLSAFPERIREQMESNSLRLNGTRSLRRECREHRRFADFVANIVLGFVLLLVPANALLLVVHVIIPLPFVGDALSCFHPDPAVWEGQLHDNRIGEKHSRVYMEHGGTYDGAHAWQNVLWTCWPVILVGGAILIVLAVRTFGRYYLNSLRELEGGVRQRTLEYLQHDLGQAESPDDWGDAEPMRQEVCVPPTDISDDADDDDERDGGV